jgi:hypothetical protein
MQKEDVEFAVEEFGMNLHQTLARTRYNSPILHSHLNSILEGSATLLWDNHTSTLACLLSLQAVSHPSPRFVLFVVSCRSNYGKRESKQEAVPSPDNPDSRCRSRHDSGPGPDSILHLESADHVHIRQHFPAFDRTLGSA